MTERKRKGQGAGNAGRGTRDAADGDAGAAGDVPDERLVGGQLSAREGAAELIDGAEGRLPREPRDYSVDPDDVPPPPR